MDKKMKVLLVSLMLVLLSACNKQDASTENTSESKKTSNTQITGKPHAAIYMDFEYLNSIVLNETLEIKLEFKVGHDVEALQVEYRTSEGLTLLDTQTQFQFNALAKNTIESITVRVIPQQAGEQMLYISAVMSVSGSSQSRAFVVPVNTASTNQLKSSGSTVPKGMQHIPSQNVISMPASEPKN